MGAVYYSCPQMLWSHWWRPVERAGYSVQPYPDGYIPARAGPAESAAGETGGRIQFGQGILDVTTAAAPDRGGLEYQLFMWPPGTTTREIDQDLAASVERIMLASGAEKILSKPLRCKYLYRCPFARVERWWERLREIDLDVDLLEPHSPIRPGPIAGRPAYVNGVVSRPGAGVSIFTGPALDPDTGDDFDYLALDYRAGPLGLFAGPNRDLAENLDKVLVSDGATRIAVRWRIAGL